MTILHTILPEKSPRPEVVPQIWENSRKHYARLLKEVEAEIQEAWIDKKEEEPRREIPKEFAEQADEEREEEQKGGEKEKENSG
jgi:hypothetical protein